MAKKKVKVGKLPSDFDSVIGPALARSRYDLACAKAARLNLEKPRSDDWREACAAAQGAWETLQIELRKHAP